MSTTPLEYIKDNPHIMTASLSGTLVMTPRWDGVNGNAPESRYSPLYRIYGSQNKDYADLFGRVDTHPKAQALHKETGNEQKLRDYR